MLRLRIFVSSPGDVAQERLVAERVVTRLGAEFAGAVTLDAYFWEYEPMVITQDYQEQIPPPSQFDVVHETLLEEWDRARECIQGVETEAEPDAATPPPRPEANDPPP